MGLQPWESLQDAITVYTALSPATIQTSDKAAEVPQELITEILQFLPAKTLLRFRCISKSLCGIIDSPDFIKSRLTLTSENRTHRKIIVPHLSKHINPIPIHVLDMDGPFPPELHKGNPTNSGNHHGLQPVNQLRKLRDVFVQCNGLVLLPEGLSSLVVWKPSTLVVWNPSTRKCRKLPVLPSSLKAWGFGYDSSIDDYKVLAITLWNDPTYGIWILDLGQVIGEGLNALIISTIIARILEFVLWMVLSIS
ncbi:F-box protein CPR1-like [Euphorbia lathyris]|uniref:F-box protein CPR1-like n=1 Tax=Euphorbia lathyris TaxID=212925 RepID=UPI003313BB65